LNERTRRKTRVLARKIAYCLCREAGYSSPEIGRAFSQRDHTTVLTGSAYILRAVEKGLQPYAVDVPVLRRLLGLGR
jgi:chromosomal replication initiation ATPase DnaA